MVTAAKLSFGRHVKFVEDFDPSLPEVKANPHVLHRVFTICLKTRGEACGDRGGQVRLKPAFI